MSPLTHTQHTPFEALLNTAPLGIYLVDDEFRIREVNPIALPVFSHIPELIGQDFDKVVRILWPKAYADDVVRRFRHTLETGEPYFASERIEERVDLGQRESYEWQINRLLLPNGRYGVVCYFRDISQEMLSREAMEKINKDQQQLASIIESSDDAIISKDLNGIISSWNKGAERIFGYKADEVIGKPVSMLIPEDRQNEEPQILQRIIKGERIDHYDTIRQRKDGTLVNISLTISPVRDASGVIVGASKIARDISERKRAEAELKRFAAILEERVTERTQLLEDQTVRLRQLAVELTEVEQKERRRLAEVLHDHLQQYLVAAKMRLDLLERREVNIDKTGLHEARSYIDQAVTASRQLTAELRPPVLYEGGLSAGLRYLVERMKQQHKIQVNLTTSGDVEPGSDLIKVMIYQCVQELLFNAVKYAKVGECFVGVSRLGNKIRIAVEDKGFGFNVSNLGNNDKGGFGLFSIRERIKAIGGEFKMSSTIGKGSTFVISIPDEADTTVEDEDPKAPQKKFVRERLQREGIVVLVADDHLIIRQSIASLLFSQPFIKEVIEAGNGEEAIKKAEATDPDIILMDVNMPGMNGIEATQILSKRNPRSKVIGLSVQAEAEMAKTMKAAGAVAYFNKGDDTASLIEAIKEFAPQQFLPI